MSYRIPILEKFCWQEPIISTHGDPSTLILTPAKGHRYIVKNGIGTWLGKDDSIAWFNGTTWLFDAPDEGWQLYNIAAEEGEKQIVYLNPTDGWVSASSTSADKIKLGDPTDGFFTDGLLDFVPENLVVDVVDDINEILKDLAPANALTLSGTTLSSNAILKTGKLPRDLSSGFYENGSGSQLSPGVTISNIIITSGLTITSPTPTTTFNKGDEGFLKVKQAIGNNTYNIVANLDIVANFNKTILGPLTQNISTWNTLGSGDPCTNGVVTLSNSKGSLQITSCGWYNSFNKWQKMNCQINVSNLDPGFNGWKLLHDLSTDQETNAIIFYYDNNTAALNFSSAPELAFYQYGGNTKWISGVRYYTTGDEFLLTYVGENVYKNYYHSTSVSTWTCPGISGTQIKNPGSAGITESAPPTVNGSITHSQYNIINAASIRNENVLATVNLMHPHRTTVTANTPTHGIMINTMPILSTDVLEPLEDEMYRLPVDAYDTIPGAITGLWNSTTELINGDALIYTGSLQYPNVNLSTKLPVGPNYTEFTGNQVYYRAFKKTGVANSSVALTLTNLIGTDVGIIGSGNVNVEVKLPTQTGWLDAGKSYDSGTFGNGVDGTGCKTSQSGAIWNLTFGTKSTANSGNLIIVRITFRNTTSVINQIQVNW